MLDYHHPDQEDRDLDHLNLPTRLLSSQSFKSGLSVINKGKLIFSFQMKFFFKDYVDM